MRIGNFWGITAPMAIIVFEDSGMLKSFLAHADLDVKKEFAFLERALQQCDYVIPEVPFVSESLAPTLMIRCGQIASISDLENAQLGNELFHRVLRGILERLSMGGGLQVPERLSEFVKQSISAKEFSVSEIPKVVRRVVKSIPEGSVRMQDIAEQFEVKMRVPDFVDTPRGRTRLSDLDKAFFRFFLERRELIHECAKCCASKVTEEETVLGNSFFYLVTGNVRKFYYSVQSMFYAIRDKRSPSYLLECINECRDGVEKYVACLAKYVNVDAPSGLGVTAEEGRKIISEGGADCEQFFDLLLRNWNFSLSCVSRDELIELVKVFQVVNQFCQKGFSDICGRQRIGEDWKSLNNVGICGINDHQMELLFDSVDTAVFRETVNVKKTEEEMKAIQRDLNDIRALLDTLIPIGRRIS